MKMQIEHLIKYCFNQEGVGRLKMPAETPLFMFLQNAYSEFPLSFQKKDCDEAKIAVEVGQDIGDIIDYMRQGEHALNYTRETLVKMAESMGKSDTLAEVISIVSELGSVPSNVLMMSSFKDFFKYSMVGAQGYQGFIDPEGLLELHIIPYGSAAEWSAAIDACYEIARLMSLDCNDFLDGMCAIYNGVVLHGSFRAVIHKFMKLLPEASPDCYSARYAPSVFEISNGTQMIQSAKCVYSCGVSDRISSDSIHELRAFWQIRLDTPDYKY